MAYYNQNFYNRNSTFQNIPPPPSLSSIYIPPMLTDQEFVKKFERMDTKVGGKAVSITEIKDKMCALVLLINDLKDKEKELAVNIKTLTNERWLSTVSEMKENRTKIDEILSILNDSCLENMRKALTKRSAKRLRLKHKNSKRRNENDEMIKAKQELSRKIDESLQKIRDDIDKVKQEEDAKLEADSILREVLRKKHDARKCVVKLEALVRLRRARRNTAAGRGELCSDTDETDFNSNIAPTYHRHNCGLNQYTAELNRIMLNTLEKLISLWKGRLASYGSEEQGLRDKLQVSQPPQPGASGGSGGREAIMDTLDSWQTFLFDGTPQFQGDVDGFLTVRALWDQYVSNDGTSLPVGWVVP